MSDPQGELVVSGGSVLSNNDLSQTVFNINTLNVTLRKWLIGRVSARGKATVTGAGSKWTNARNLSIATYCELNILNGGEVSNQEGRLAGIVNVDGANSKC